MVDRVNGPRLEGNLVIYMYQSPVKGKNILKIIKKEQRKAVWVILMPDVCYAF